MSVANSQTTTIEAGSSFRVLDYHASIESSLTWYLIWDTFDDGDCLNCVVLSFDIYTDSCDLETAHAEFISMWRTPRHVFAEYHADQPAKLSQKQFHAVCKLLETLHFDVEHFNTITSVQTEDQI